MSRGVRIVGDACPEGLVHGYTCNIYARSNLAHATLVGPEAPDDGTMDHRIGECRVELEAGAWDPKSLILGEGFLRNEFPF